MKRIAIVLIVSGCAAIAWYFLRWFIWRINVPPPNPYDSSEGVSDKASYTYFEHLLTALLIGTVAISLGAYLLSLPKKPKSRASSA